MTISSSLNAGVAGLSANATRLATISDNIANSATQGYKRVETEFSAMVTSGNSGTYTAGGVRTQTNRLVAEHGALVTTNNATDLAVRGTGFLPVAQATEVLAGNGNPQMFMTTTASFRLDAEGYLRTESGLMLLGWRANADGSIPNLARDTSASLEPIQIALNQYLSEPTTAITMGVNLPATETTAGAAGDALELPIEYFDNLGRSESLNVTFTPTVPATGSSNEWTMVITDSASGGAIIGDYTVTFDNTPSAGGTLASVSAPISAGGAYDGVAGSVVVNAAGGPIELSIGQLFTNNGLTQRSDSFAPLNIAKDGSPAGNMTSVEVDESGRVYAYFDTGASAVIFQIPLVDVPNPNGMIALNNQLFQPSAESGSFFLWDAGDGPTGEIVPYAREESTTDVAAELTDMIQTQRAYSSNAKVIQTVDEMLQETTNIKR
ncbi:flagellar hook protein FlgE [Sagittula stellata]|uniref:Flagellar hook protein FlgE n=1 Tax=Sagittula stellata (strain ATCC 700073 / DSM 11524 / E-37) TaxID=388399 RepID=A3K2Z6_SAGS3|nr:flagellar hook-basal body complex protein [Sagittula stellata]EBA08555.1 flagellar hook protein FlgE, putative [Sagittula stellata E-37]